jgi:HEAT repeat protein
MRKLGAIFCVVAVVVAARDEASGSKPDYVMLDMFEVAPGWKVRMAASDGMVHWVGSLAFDRHGNAWLVEKSETGSRLCRLTDTDNDGVYDRRDEIRLSIPRPVSVAVWGDWLYLVGDGQLKRWRIGTNETGQPKRMPLEEPKETLLEGLGAGPAFLSVSAAGVYVRGRGNGIRQPGRPANGPRSEDAVLLLPHESGTIRWLASSQTTSVAPIAVDPTGNIWLVHETTNRQVQLLRWQANTETFSPIGRHHPSELPVANGETQRDSGTRPAGRTEASTAEAESAPAFGQGEFGGEMLPVPPRIRTPLPSTVIGLVGVYRSPNDEAPTNWLWARAWPPALVGLSEKEKDAPTLLVSVKPSFRASVIFTALAGDRQGNIYLAGCYRLPANQERGFLVRLEPPQGQSQAKSPDDLSRLEERQLLEHLVRAHPAELLAVQEEIYRRGKTILPALVSLAESLTANEHPADTASPRASVRVLQLLAALRSGQGGNLPPQLADSIRRLGVTLVRHNSPELVLAGIALLRGDTSESAQAALVQLLEDRAIRVRQAAVLALAEIGSAEVAATLANFLRFYDGREPDWLATLARGLEWCGESGLAALWELANSGSASELAHALAAWTRLRSARALEYVGKWLEHPHLNDEQRCSILVWWSLGARQYPADVRPIRNWLAKQDHPAPALLAAALQALAVQAAEEGFAVGQLAAKWLDHDDLSVRLAAMSCLRSTRELAVETILLRRVHENARSPQERLLAAEVLLAQRSTKIHPVLLELLVDRSQTPALREQVAVLLLRYGDETLRQQCLARLRDWPADMWQVLLHHLRPEKDLLLHLAQRYRNGNVIPEEAGLPWYWRIALARPVGLKEALIEALVVWCADDPAAWRALGNLSLQ